MHAFTKLGEVHPDQTSSGGTTSTQTFYLDALGRTACYHQQTSGTAPAGCGTTPGDNANHYSDDDDSPAWTATTPTSGAATTHWYGTGLDGNLAVDVASTGSASTVTFQLIGLHGDVWLTTSQAATASPDGTAIYSDEYGNTAAGAQRYAWLGGKQRATEGLAQLITMGARIYAPNLGRFTSTDPVYGGNDNTYTYPVDPINAFDLNGECWICSAWHALKKHWKAVAVTTVVVGLNFVPVAGELADGIESEELAADAGQIGSRAFSGNQRAVIHLVKAAKRAGGISREDVDALSEWADEYEVPNSHGPMSHATRSGFGRQPHIKINGTHVRLM